MSLDATKLEKYTDMHKADMMRFKQEMETYTEGMMQKMETYTEGSRCGLSLLFFLLQIVPVLACFV
jgi:hypothetical protein